MKTTSLFVCLLLLAQFCPMCLEAADESGRDLRKIFSKEIDLITIPAEQLPSGCRLAPDKPGSKFLPSNPATITDPELLGMVLIPFGLTDMSKFEEIIKEISAGFSAIYHDGKGGREIGVNLLLFKDEDQARKRSGEFSPMAGRPFRQGRHVLTIWSDGTPTRTEQQMRKYFKERMDGRKGGNDSNRDDNQQIIRLVLAAVVAIFVLIQIAVFAMLVRPWLRALLQGAPVSLALIVAMRLRGNPPSVLINAYISLKRAGISATIGDVENAYIDAKNRYLRSDDLVELVKQAMHSR